MNLMRRAPKNPAKDNPLYHPKNDPSLASIKNILLHLEGISVSFDGFKAVNDLNLYIENGELRCIIGPNGAGKSTIMDIITGKTRPDSGTAWFGERLNLLRMNESEIAQAGIGRKFQKPSVFENHSVFHNLELAISGCKTVRSSLFSRLDAEEEDFLEHIMERIGLQDKRHQRAGILSHGQKQWLEIGMLLMQRPRLLLVDEPVAGMTHQEMDRTGELLLDLKGEHSIMVVEHDMEFIRSIADKVTVLHQGSVLAEGPMAQVQANPQVIEVYLGESAC